jgi:hypothetical protein
MAKKKKEKVEEKPKLDIPVYTQKDVDSGEVDIGRSSSEEVRAIREEVMKEVLKKEGDMCLLNAVVRHYNEGKSDPQFHTRLRNIFHKPHLGVRIVKKEGRLWILRSSRSHMKAKTEKTEE